MEGIIVGQDDRISKSDQPLFYAALTNHFPDKTDQDGAGFVICTDASAGRMVDVHDRRPIALSVADALLWMDSATAYEQAEQVTRKTAMREDKFEWNPVSRDVNNSRNQGPQLIEPVES